jgi:hypothetical protein
MLSRAKDNPAMLHFLASAAGFVIVAAITVKAINTAFDWAVVIGIFGSASIFFTAIYYLLILFGWQPKNLQEEDYSLDWKFERAGEVVALPDNIDPAKRVIVLEGDDFKYFTRMNFFVQRALKTNLYQAKKDLVLSQYEWEQFMFAFDRAGITINNGTKARVIAPQIIAGGADAVFHALNVIHEFDIPASLEHSHALRAGGKSVGESPIAAEEDD